MTEARDIAELRGSQSHFAAWLGVVLLFLVFSALVLVAFSAAPRGTKFERERGRKRAEKLKATSEEANQTLTTYAWVDKNKGVARIPIHDAMRLTVAELAQKQPMPAGPIAPESQVGGTQNTAPMTAPQSSPPPPAGPSATPVSHGGHEAEAPKGAATVNPAPVAPGTQPGRAATPAAPAPPGSGQPNPAGAPNKQPTATPHGSPIPVPGKSP